jgi:arginase
MPSAAVPHPASGLPLPAGSTVVDLTVIGAPTSAGASAPGQELAPTALREAGLMTRLAHRGLVVRDVGDGPLQRWSPDRDHRRAQNVDQVAAAVQHTTVAVAAALHTSARVLVLGGDCTVGAASFQALSRHDNSAALIYYDLDADMNTPDSTEHGALDWMGLGMLIGVSGAVSGVVTLGQLRPERLVLLGFYGTSSTEWELKQLERYGIRTVTDAAVHADPRAAARAALAGLPADTGAIAVHFDVDVIDFVDAPLSEDPNRNLGISLDDALAGLTELLRDHRIRVLTVTELNPQHAAADATVLPRFVAGLANALGRNEIRRQRRPGSRVGGSRTGRGPAVGVLARRSRSTVRTGQHRRRHRHRTADRRRRIHRPVGRSGSQAPRPRPRRATGGGRPRR